jgi:hypothetical protein
MVMDIYCCNRCGYELRVPKNEWPSHSDRCPSCKIFFCGGECCGDDFSASFVRRVEALGVSGNEGAENQSQESGG